MQTRFFNLDRKKFVISEAELLKQVGEGAVLREVKNFRANQLLVVASVRDFSDLYAIAQCREAAYAKG